jgi:hypothetical protein
VIDFIEAGDRIVQLSLYLEELKLSFGIVASCFTSVIRAAFMVARRPRFTRSWLRALAWAEYLKTHAKRVYASVTMPEVDAAKAVAAKLKSGALTDGFTRRDILQKEWSRLTDQNEVQRALDLLVDFDWLSCVTIQTGGRPRTTYSINPRLRP